MLKISYYGSPFLGIFFKANNSLILAPIDAQEKDVKAIENTLKVDTIKLLVAGSNLIGAYTVMNNNGIILPNLVRENEISILKKAGLNVLVSSELLNAHGNNICANDKGGIINPRINPEKRKKIEDTLGIELVPLSIAEYTTVGSACIASNNGFLVHYSASKDEIKKLEDALKVKGDKGTLNNGVGFVGIGIVLNDRSFVVGETTTGFEMGKVQNTLDYL